MPHPILATVSWSEAAFTLCVACVGLSIPSSPSSIGVFHGAVCLGLATFAVPTEHALCFAVV